MRNRPSRRRDVLCRGFTLIELMIVVAIIGILASVAIPTFQRLTVRSKTAERTELMLRIQKAVTDYYVQHGAVKDASGVELSGDYQPPLPLAMTKRVPNWKAAGWSEVFRSGEEIMGSTYYSYWFETHEPIGRTPATLTISATGDLDGDGLPSTKTMRFEREAGMYRLVKEEPEAGMEDADTF